MKSVDHVIEALTGKPLVESIATLLRATSPDFLESEDKYRNAVALLQTALPVDMTPSVADFLATQEADIISRILYAGYNGFRANVANFHHPFTLDFTRMDYFDCVKDHIIGHFPVNYESARISDAFYKALPEELHETYHDVTDYFIHMECAGPKLAHYAGYIFANQLLPWVEPGYRKDWHQTQIYERQINEYMGNPVK